jgi:hypothetical protein
VLTIVMIFAITSWSFAGFKTPARYRMMFESAVKRRFGRMLLSWASLPLAKSVLRNYRRRLDW